MIQNGELLDACRFAVKQALDLGATDAEAFAIYSAENSISIERNDINTGVSMDYSGIGLRIFSGRSMGFSGINSLNREDIRKAVAAGVGMARAAPDGGEYNVLPDKPSDGSYNSVSGLYDPEAESFSMEDALRMALEMLDAAREDPRVMVDSGGLDSGVIVKAIATSKGIELEERRSVFSYSIMGMAREGSDVSSFNYRYGGKHMLADVDTAATGREFASLVLNTLGARKTESFRGPIILSPDAGVDLLISPILYLVDAENVQKGRSSFAGKISEAVASSLLSIKDDGRLPGGMASSRFDREGMPHSPLDIVENGILRSYLHNTKTAVKAGLSASGSTGHASGGISGIPGIGSTNIDVAAGDISFDEMVSEIKRGILVTRLSGYPDPISGQYAGTVKGGMLIENGEIVRPITGTMIAGNLLEDLKNITAVSRERELLYSVTAPYIRVKEVSVISGS